MNDIISNETSRKILRITLVRSPIGYTQRQKSTVRALGLHRMNETVQHQDTPVLRGMMNKVIHLIKVVEIEDRKA